VTLTLDDTASNRRSDDNEDSYGSKSGRSGFGSSNRDDTEDSYGSKPARSGGLGSGTGGDDEDSYPSKSNRGNEDSYGSSKVGGDASYNCTFLPPPT